jgi:pSer/pThr/pTyr-binding forkhead associated (FHA) protein
MASSLYLRRWFSPFGRGDMIRFNPTRLSEMNASLVVLVGKQKGREIPLPETMFIIGRDPLCHLRPHSSLVSRRHCAIARWNGRLLIRDLKSANGTFLNNKRIKNQVEVQSGDILDVGDISFSFQITRSEEEIGPDLKDDGVNWLVSDASDSAVLDPGVSTMMFDVSQIDMSEEAATAGDAEKAKGSKSLSAGKYLKDYLGS